ncbi:hypothetical protein K466DRAFT_582328 [Polyporus arcularius HHB13444]|uniref:Uncharacterized protein n=1 Tax=Polyporus arcularius HHB13444 TaxID=1314778 RepID=A0A5C3PQC0_9APHY|nr:hypothetical protein K466DRAFT_582328 [Polyporus arcularius HHB13444]
MVRAQNVRRPRLCSARANVCGLHTRSLARLLAAQASWILGVVRLLDMVATHPTKLQGPHSRWLASFYHLLCSGHTVLISANHTLSGNGRSRQPCDLAPSRERTTEQETPQYNEASTLTDISCLLAIETKEGCEYGVSSYRTEAIVAGLA